MNRLMTALLWICCSGQISGCCQTGARPQPSGPSPSPPAGYVVYCQVVAPGPPGAVPPGAFDLYGFQCPHGPGVRLTDHARGGPVGGAIGIPNRGGIEISPNGRYVLFTANDRRTRGSFLEPRPQWVLDLRSHDFLRVPGRPDSTNAEWVPAHPSTLGILHNARGQLRCEFMDLPSGRRTSVRLPARGRSLFWGTGDGFATLLRGRRAIEVRRWNGHRIARWRLPAKLRADAFWPAPGGKHLLVGAGRALLLGRVGAALRQVMTNVDEPDEVAWTPDGSRCALQLREPAGDPSNPAAHVMVRALDVRDPERKSFRYDWVEDVAAGAHQQLVGWAGGGRWLLIWHDSGRALGPSPSLWAHDTRGTAEVEVFGPHGAVNDYDWHSGRLPPTAPPRARKG